MIHAYFKDNIFCVIYIYNRLEIYWRLYHYLIKCDSKDKLNNSKRNKELKRLMNRFALHEK